MESFWSNVAAMFGSSDSLPYTDQQAIQACERDLEDPGQSSSRGENLMKLAWALVHSRREADVRRGIAILDTQLSSTSSQDKDMRRETLYLLGVGYFRVGEYGQSRTVVDEALKDSPNFYQAVTLKTMVEQKITSEGMIGVGIAAGAVAAVTAVAAIAIAAASKR